MVVETEKPQESIFSFWRRGLVNDRELRNLSPPLLGFLRENGFIIHSKYLPVIYEHFKDQDMIMVLGQSKKPFYLVDPALMKPHFEEVEEAILFAREESHQKMSEQEMLSHQKRILRVGGKKKGYQAINLEEAQQNIFEFSLEALQGFGSESESVARFITGRSRIYLKGISGEFSSLDHFKRVALPFMIRRALVDRLRLQTNRARRQSQTEAAVPLTQPGLPILKKEDFGDSFNDLDPVNQRLVELKEPGVYSLEQISRLLKADLGVDMTVLNLRQRYLRLRRRLWHPISEDEIGALLASVGNSEAKALLLSRMALAPDQPFSQNDMGETIYKAQEIDEQVPLPNDYRAWKIDARTLKGYCLSMFEPSGLVIKAEGQDEFLLTPWGLNLGLAFGGWQLEKSQKHQTALVILWGEANSSSLSYQISAYDGTLIRTKQRAPFTLFRMYRYLLGTKLPVSVKGLASTIGRGRQDESKISLHLERLREDGILLFDSDREGTSSSLFYYPEESSLVKPRGVVRSTFMGEEPISSRVYRVLITHPGKSFRPNGVVEVLVEEDSQLEKRQGLEGTVQTKLYEFAEKELICIKRPFPNGTKSIVDLTDEQRDRLEDIIGTLKKFQTGDLEIIRRGKELAFKFANNPQLAREALYRARVASNHAP